MCSWTQVIVLHHIIDAKRIYHKPPANFGEKYYKVDSHCSEKEWRKCKFLVLWIWQATLLEEIKES